MDEGLGLGGLADGPVAARKGNLAGAGLRAGLGQPEDTFAMAE